MDKLVERLVEMDAKATPAPWGVSKNFANIAVRGGHEQRPIGAAVDDVKNTTDYAHELVEGRHNPRRGYSRREALNNIASIVSLRNALPALVEYVTAEECLHYIASRSYDSEVWSFRDAGEYEAASVRLSAARAALLSALGGDK